MRQTMARDTPRGRALKCVVKSARSFNFMTRFQLGPVKSVLLESHPGREVARCPDSSN